MKIILNYLLVIFIVFVLFFATVSLGFSAWILLTVLVISLLIIYIWTLFFTIKLPFSSKWLPYVKDSQSKAKSLNYIMHLYFIFSIILLLILCIFGYLIPRYMYYNGYFSGTNNLSLEEKNYINTIANDDYNFDLYINDLDLGYYVKSVKKIQNKGDLENSKCKGYISSFPAYEANIDIKTYFGLTQYNLKMCNKINVKN